MAFSKNWFGHQVSQGEPLIVRWLNRKFGNRKVEVFKIDGDTGAVTIKGLNPASANVPVVGATAWVSGLIAGHNGTGSIALANAKVGDKVLFVQDVKATGTNLSTSFESTISVAGHIKQTAVTDLSADTQLLVVLAQQS